MEIYWKREDIPELKPLQASDRTEVMVATAVKRMKDPVLLLLVIPMFLMVGLGNYLGDAFLPFRFGASVGGGLMGGASVWLIGVVMNGRGRHHLAEEIRRRGLDQSSGLDPKLSPR